MDMPNTNNELQQPENDVETPENGSQVESAGAAAESEMDITPASAETVTVEASEEEPVAASYEHEDVPSAGDGEEVDEDERAGEAEEAEEGARIKRGALIEATIASTTPTQIMVDLGEGVQGIITSRELERLDRSTLENLKEGEPLLVYVVRAKGEEGYPVLSINRAKEEQDWREAEQYADSKDAYDGHIAGYNKGGLIVRFGRLRGFVPASQISPEREHRSKGQTPDERWSEMLNEPITVKVVEVNRSRNRLILSERAASREVRERQKEKLISTLKVGEIRKGRVISLTDFGAFVDLGGADGLIHLTELSWKHVSHPRELLNVGDEVEVKVISVDNERKRIGLSRKSLEKDPWNEVVEQFKENQLVQGRITKLTRFGAFASLVNNEEIEGLIHVSELADYRVDHPRDVVAVGDVLTLRVVKIDAERRRLGLSLKRVDSARYMDTDWSID